MLTEPALIDDEVWVAIMPGAAIEGLEGIPHRLRGGEFLWHCGNLTGGAQPIQ